MYSVWRALCYYFDMLSVPLSPQLTKLSFPYCSWRLRRKSSVRDWFSAYDIVRTNKTLTLLQCERGENLSISGNQHHWGWYNPILLSVPWSSKCWRILLFPAYPCISCHQTITKWFAIIVLIKCTKSAHRKSSIQMRPTPPIALLLSPFWGQGWVHMGYDLRGSWELHFMSFCCPDFATSLLCRGNWKKNLLYMEELHQPLMKVTSMKRIMNKVSQLHQ